MRLIFTLVGALLLLAAGAHGATYFLNVAGLGGLPEYDNEFKQWTGSLEKALAANGPNCRVTTMQGDGVSRASLADQFARLSRELKPDDQFALLLLGHGTADESGYKFNVPGPDVTAGQLAEWLEKIPAQTQLVVNMTSASGASLAPLAKKGRIVITATKSGTEKNATIFARYWIAALQDPAADADKNGAISALEAFRYTEAKTANYFKQEKLLATEHPLLDDRGTQQGARDPSPANSQGMLASAFVVLRAGGTEAVKPGKQDLIAKRDALQISIDHLKYQKAAMPEQEYKHQLADLLLQLAKTQAELDQ